jgi:hypothetical protein
VCAVKTTAKIRIACLTIALFFVSSALILRLGNARLVHAGTSATLALDSLDGLEIHAAREPGLDPVKVTADVATYRGRRALHLRNDDSSIANGNPSGGQSLAIVKGTEFRGGSLEVDIAGRPRKGAPPDARGFVGLAFHVQDNGSRFEAFYLRLTNGRAEDQLRRNHSTQYVSEPDFPWFRLRKENPGVYESYVDIEPEAWTKLKVVVAGTKARLYVNGATQPCLIVNDLKLGDSHGQVALWDGSDTEAYFSNLKIE